LMLRFSVHKDLWLERTSGRTPLVKRDTTVSEFVLATRVAPVIGKRSRKSVI